MKPLYTTSLIHILSPLARAERRRLARWSARHEREDFRNQRAAVHVARNCWSAATEPHPSLHSIARQMMVIAGRTFRYELIKRGLYAVHVSQPGVPGSDRIVEVYARSEDDARHICGARHQQGAVVDELTAHDMQQHMLAASLRRKS